MACLKAPTRPGIMGALLYHIAIRTKLYGAANDPTAGTRKYSCGEQTNIVAEAIVQGSLARLGGCR